MNTQNIRVSALVSVYNADTYIEQCLQDLTNQTLFQSGALEILVIDCDSPGQEVTVVREYQQRFDNIVYVRWPRRISLYAAWNVGIRAARGEYLTNANSDDRHAPDGIEAHMRCLDQHPEVDLVYADVFESSVHNQTFADNPGTIRYCYGKYFPPEVLLRNQIGCQPLWRHSLHDKIGLFNPELRAAGDYEFNLRFALAGCKALYIPQPLGSFLNRSDSISTQDDTMGREVSVLREQYITPANIIRLYQLAGWSVQSNDEKLAALHDMVIRSAHFILPWHPGRSFTDPKVGFCALLHALELAQGHTIMVNNLACMLRMIGKNDDARRTLSSLCGQDTPAVIKHNLSLLTESGDFPPLELYTEAL